MRIRHYGFLANRVCREKLALCRALLGAETTPQPGDAEPVPETGGAVEGRPAAHACPVCGAGRMVIVETLRALPIDPGGRAGREPPHERAGFDTS